MNKAIHLAAHAGTLLLRKSQMAFDFSKPLHTETHERKGGVRHLLSGAAVSVRATQAKVHVADHSGAKASGRQEETTMKKLIAKIAKADTAKKTKLWRDADMSRSEGEEVVREMIMSLPGHYKLHDRQYGTNLVDKVYEVYGWMPSMLVSESMLLGLQAIHPEKVYATFTLGLDAIHIKDAPQVNDADIKWRKVNGEYHADLGGNTSAHIRKHESGGWHLSHYPTDEGASSPMTEWVDTYRYLDTAKAEARKNLAESQATYKLPTATQASEHAAFSSEFAKLDLGWLEPVRQDIELYAWDNAGYGQPVEGMANRALISAQRYVDEPDFAAEMFETAIKDGKLTPGPESEDAIRNAKMDSLRAQLKEIAEERKAIPPDTRVESELDARNALDRRSSAIYKEMDKLLGM